VDEEDSPFVKNRNDWDEGPELKIALSSLERAVSPSLVAVSFHGRRRASIRA
jgi:hypothetical protein